MRVVFELSREHPTLPTAEARACLAIYHGGYEEIYHNGIYVAEVNEEVIEKICSRVAMSFSINEYVGEGMKAVKHLRIKGTFRVEGGRLHQRKKLGELIVKEDGVRVNMKNPENVVRIFQKGGEIILGREICPIDRSQFEERRANKWPFSLPTAMHPRIARVLVNLSSIKEGQILLDPFCGAGGILIEAGLIGCNVIGIEIKENVADGCERNLKYYGISDYDIMRGDMRDFDFSHVDAIVTDFPYGRASHLSDEMGKLYREAIKKMADWTSRAVIGMPSLKFLPMVEKYFDVKQIHPARVHKSLTRFFYVLGS